MSKTGSAAKVKLNSFDDLFGSSEMQTAGEEQIINAPLAELHDFKNGGNYREYPPVWCTCTGNCKTEN